MNRTFARLAIASAATLCFAGAHATGVGPLVDSHDTTISPSAQAAAAAAATARANAASSARSNQRQQQGQAQSSRNSNRNSVSGTQSARTGDVTAAQVSRTGDMNGGTMTGGAVTVEGSSTVYQAQERNPVATAYAAPLTSSNGTCSGSTSAGGQGAAFGVSFGTTWTDSGCDARYDAEALRSAGMPRAAIARLCLKPEIAKAMEAAGTPCPGTEGKRAAAILNGTAEDTANAPQYQDPIVRARLNLPPLN